ncbi:MAG: hypothetical protein M3016_09775 [Actinomycetota bacterium]|nr:hypothetical protein [Actinomycetota bacterium]
MLFDLRSRGRRRTVQFVYLGLAILMGGGLVLFGVGAGNGNGGLLNAFTGNGSGNSQSSVLTNQEKAAVKRTQRTPSDPAAWGALVTARWEIATSGSDYSSTQATFTASGRKELAATANAWARYVQLTKQPDATLATLAAHAYGQLGQYPGSANAWQIVAKATPTSAKDYACLAVTRYAAKQNPQGDQALRKALALAPALSRSKLKAEIQAAKKVPAIAQSC